MVYFRRHVSSRPGSFHFVSFLEKNWKEKKKKKILQKNNSWKWTKWKGNENKIEQKQNEEIKKSKRKTKISKWNKKTGHMSVLSHCRVVFERWISMYAKTFSKRYWILKNRYIAKHPIKKMNELFPDNYTVAKKLLDYLQKH